MHRPDLRRDLALQWLWPLHPRVIFNSRAFALIRGSWGFDLSLIWLRLRSSVFSVASVVTFDFAFAFFVFFVLETLKLASFSMTQRASVVKLGLDLRDGHPEMECNSKFLMKICVDN